MPFAQSGHMEQSHTCRTQVAVGLPKQRQVKVDWYELLCLGSPTVQLATPDCVMLYHVTRSCKGRIMKEPIQRVKIGSNGNYAKPPWGPFLEAPEKFSHPESRFQISNLMITELFYSHIINMNRGSLHTRSLRRIHLAVFRHRLIENGFSGPKSFRGFRETGTRSLFTTHIMICKVKIRNNNAGISTRRAFFAVVT